MQVFIALHRVRIAKLLDVREEKVTQATTNSVKRLGKGIQTIEEVRLV